MLSNGTTSSPAPAGAPAGSAGACAGAGGAGAGAGGLGAIGGALASAGGLGAERTADGAAGGAFFAAASCTSFRVSRPPKPLPWIVLGSRPRSASNLRTTGDVCGGAGAADVAATGPAEGTSGTGGAGA